MDSLRTILFVIGGVFSAIGVLVSLRGYLRSIGKDKLDYRAYFKGMALIGMGVGLMALSEEL